MKTPAKMFLVFLTPGYDTLRLHYNRSVLGPDGVRIPKNFISNEKLLEELKGKCPEVEFTARTLEPSQNGYERLLMEIRSLKDELDGVIIVGNGTRSAFSGTERQPLAFTGLPTIIVDNLFKLQSIPYRICKKEGKVLLASLDREHILSKEKSEAMFNDLLDKIRIIESLHRLRKSKILFIKDSMSDIDKVDYQILPPKYNLIIQNRLKEYFGTEFIFRDLEEMIEIYHSITDDNAGKIADMWISEATAVQDSIEGEILKAAKLYLTIKQIKDSLDEEPTAIMVQDYFRALEEDKMVTTALPMMEFQKKGIIGCYQSYTGTTLSQLLGYFMTGRMSYVHDMVIDIYNNVTHHIHCGSPINNVWGKENLSYKIRDYTTGKWYEELKRRDWAVPAEVSFPVGVPVTIWKVLPMQKKIMVFTGTSIDGAGLYREWEDIICRNKLPVQVADAEKIQFHQDIHVYGCHFAATFGDIREKIKQLATFIDFEVDEWDR